MHVAVIQRANRDDVCNISATRVKVSWTQPLDDSCLVLTLLPAGVLVMAARPTVVYRQLIITIFRMPIYPVLNKANDPEYWLLIGRESGQVSHEY